MLSLTSDRPVPSEEGSDWLSYFLEIFEVRLKIETCPSHELFGFQFQMNYSNVKFIPGNF